MCDPQKEVLTPWDVILIAIFPAFCYEDLATLNIMPFFNKHGIVYYKNCIFEEVLLFLFC